MRTLLDRTNFSSSSSGQVAAACRVTGLVIERLWYYLLQHVDIAALLIKYSTCVNAVDKWGFTPLHEAAQKGRTQLCALLVSHTPRRPPLASRRGGAHSALRWCQFKVTIRPRSRCTRPLLLVNVCRLNRVKRRICCWEYHFARRESPYNAARCHMEPLRRRAAGACSAGAAVFDDVALTS